MLKKRFRSCFDFLDRKLRIRKRFGPCYNKFELKVVAWASNVGKKESKVPKQDDENRPDPTIPNGTQS